MVLTTSDGCLGCSKNCIISRAASEDIVHRNILDMVDECANKEMSFDITLSDLARAVLKRSEA